MDLYAAYHAKYGTNARVFLRTLGGDPDAVIRSLIEQCAEPNPLASMLGVSPDPTEEDAHNAILREIKRLYFSGISRDAAVAVANAIGSLGSLCLCDTIPELTFSGVSFADTWSYYHPDKEPIIHNIAL